MLLAGCGDSQKSLEKKALELARHIPDLGNLEQSEGWLTEGFYAALDEMVNLPELTPVLHQWEFWYTAADGSAVASDIFTGLNVEKADATHAKAVIKVQPDDTDYEVEEHTMLMEKVNGKWLLADYDDTLEACSNYIANSRKEQAVRDAIGDYLVKEIGEQYLKGEICIPVIMFVAAEEEDDTHARFFGDFWVDWYNKDGDTLNTVSGGNHSGCMTLEKQGDGLKVTAFDQTVDGAGNDRSARRIFGSHYDIYHNIHSNQNVRDAARKEAIRNYCRQHGIAAKYIKDYGWQAVEL